MNKAIFLDRDGVINESHTNRVKFVNSPNDFYLLPGAADAIATLRESGYKIFVVTNQAGVGYGLIQQSTLDKIHSKMLVELKKENPQAIIDDIMTCTHHPKKDRCVCRKPKPGMLIALAVLHNIDLSQSWMVGDMQTDIEAGTDAGCGTYLIDAEHSLLDFAKMINKKTSINDLIAFLKGYKPACLHNWNKPSAWFYRNEDLERLKTYTSIEGIHAHLPDQTLYFRDEAQKDRFLQAIKGVKPDSKDYHRQLGLVLGYPPKAVDFYIKTLESDVSSEKATIEIHGIGFVSSARDLIENINWIWDNYPQEMLENMDTSVSYKNNYFSIPYKDQYKLTVVQDAIEKALEQ